MQDRHLARSRKKKKKKRKEKKDLKKIKARNIKGDVGTGISISRQK